MVNFAKFGYDYIKEDNVECFDNLLLIYDGGDIYWITCSDRALNRFEKYFKNSEIIIMGFGLERKHHYHMKFMTKISYKDILSDLKDNGLNDKLEILFDEQTYNKFLSFKINASTFDELITLLTNHLKILKVIKL